MRIIFFGADRWFSGPVLAALLAADFEVPVAVTKGDALTKNKKHSLIRPGLAAARPGLSKPFYLQAKTAEDISRRRLENLIRSDPDVTSGSDLSTPEAIILASFGPPFLPADVLNWPKYGCLNVHASLLPRWRGASPVFAALAAGDKETGVSIMRMTEEIDRGPILGQSSLEIRKPGILRPGLPTEGRAFLDFDNRETLTKRLGIIGGELVVETLQKLEKGQITEVMQPKKSPTPYTRRLTKESGRIDWSQSPIEIERFIRAVTPWPGAYTNGRWTMDDGRWQEVRDVKILKAHLEKVRDFREFSRFSRKTNRVKNDPMLVIDQVQLPGKTPVSWKQFLAGHPGVKLE